MKKTFYVSLFLSFTNQISCQGPDRGTIINDTEKNITVTIYCLKDMNLGTKKIPSKNNAEISAMFNIIQKLEIKDDKGNTILESSKCHRSTETGMTEKRYDINGEIKKGSSHIIFSTHGEKAEQYPYFICVAT